MEASSINAPHPDDSGDEADLFFGGTEEEQPQPQPDGVQDDGTPVEEPAPASDPQPAAEAAVAAAPEPESGPETPAEETPKTAEPAAEPSPAEPAGMSEASTEPQQGDAAPASDEGKKSGSLERGYVVFHKLPLTKRALEFLLEEINSGNAPEPRVAYFKLHETQARRVEAAMADAYSRFQQQLGEKCDLAGVSSRAFQERHVEPKQVVETNLSIT